MHSNLHMICTIKLYNVQYGRDTCRNSNGHDETKRAMEGRTCARELAVGRHEWSNRIVTRVKWGQALLDRTVVVSGRKGMGPI